MKTFLILISLIFAGAISAQTTDCKLVFDEKDPYTKTHVKRTDFKCVFYNTEVLALRFCMYSEKTDSTFNRYLVADIAYPNFLYCFSQESNVAFLMQDSSIVTLSFSGINSCGKSFIVYTTPSYSGQFFFHITDEAALLLKKQPIINVRFNVDEGHFDYKIPVTVEKIKYVKMPENIYSEPQKYIQQHIDCITN